MMQLIRCRLSFALLQSSILCIRGTRSSIYKSVKLDLLRLVESEAHLNELVAVMVNMVSVLSLFVCFVALGCFFMF